MFKNTCCDLARLTDRFCGHCGTNIELARERELQRRIEELKRKLLGTCESCSSLWQHQNYCTKCGKKMVQHDLFVKDKTEILKKYIDTDYYPR